MRRSNWKKLNTALIALFVFVIMALSVSAYADNGLVSYDQPTLREDNFTVLTPDEIREYRVYEAGAVILTVTPPATSFTVPANGQTLSITTVDIDGRESQTAATVVIPVGKPAPKAPANVNVQIIVN